MTSLRIIVQLLILHCSFFIASGQTVLSTKDKKAEKIFYTAIDSYEARNNEKAMLELRRAVEIDPLFTEAYILMGDICADGHEPEKAIGHYKAAIRTNKTFSPNLYAILAGMELGIGRYAEARSNYERFLEWEGLPEQKRSQAQAGMKKAEFAIHAMANPVPFNPVNLGDSVNTRYDEYINAITADEKWLYFTRLNPRNAESTDQNTGGQEDFYRSQGVDSAWVKARNLGPPINTHGNEGALTISPDGRMLFFAGCNREGGYGSCDIYMSRLLDGQWTEPDNLGPVVNSPQWDSQPSFSSDGRTLYFVSTRPGGFGSSDIWKTVLQSDGHWSEPVNLGDSVNTRDKEMAPFIHPDDQTLYFSSRGHEGMGGLDLFLCRRDLSGNWKHPVNLGYPINTFADEITLVVNANGNLAFISSDKLGGKGRQDIYKFHLYREARPLLTTYFKGIVYDAETKAKLEARFELVDLATAKTVAESSSDRVNGEFLLVLPSERDYALSVSRDGYLFFSGNFSLAGNNSRSTPFIKNIPMKPIRVGETVVLRNIFFDTDQFTLKDESLVELENLFALLKKNPALKIEISGHTDTVGSETHNLELSANRGRAVYQFLVGRGIAAVRLTFAGYGFSRPVDSNLTETGRANNRRTEFRVIGN